MNTTETARPEETTQNQAEEGKTIAIISYITIIGLIIAFVMNNEKKNDFASFHIRQSVGLACTGIALGIIGVIPIIGWLINLIGIFVLLYLWIMGIVNAVNLNRKPVPLLGERFENWFKGSIN
ncbi:DUF4870 domain-containing protein [Croceiramulus getboli]|nr:hypothetical protein P8624_08820 [Flavobacteriaceae bacterium YJPT1-3]